DRFQRGARARFEVVPPLVRRIDSSKTSTDRKLSQRPRSIFFPGRAVNEIDHCIILPVGCMDYNERPMKLIEQNSGVGDLMLNGEKLRQVSYHLTRYQGVVAGSGLPIPGLHRVEGSIDFDPTKDSLDWIGMPLSLKLDDGRVLRITVVDQN